MRVLPAGLLLLACAHPGRQAASPRTPPPDLSRVQVTLAPETTVNDPALLERGAELRAALAPALAGEGFRVVEKGGLLVTTSIDYVPWTSVSAASLYIVVGLRSEGTSVDQVELQKLNEVFPEPDKVGELAQSLAHALAISPRLAEYLRSR
jgi:hypothetical protein